VEKAAQEKQALQQLCDADVDAADLHLILKPDFKFSSEFKGGNEAVIKPDECTQCGRCLEVCRFDAVKFDADTNTFEVDTIECEGCGVCVDLCPEQAIDFPPVIASIGQATALLIIAEPTVSGIHDMERVGQLSRHFNIPAMVCINKYDLNPDQTKKIETLARESDIAVVGKISFDQTFTESMIQAKTIFEYNEDSQASIEVRQVWDNILSRPEFKNPVTNNIMQHL